ncbi:anti-sigma factor [Streptomyces sp. CA-249302]|uniref:anti-sigma factor n=1 Tax=Streptomyces sp. CA-249302 TaxID=3240058 RepID=UPI003D9486E4
MTTVDLHRLTGAYALHALSDDEGAAFERHLAGCEGCAQETVELRETAARMGLAAAVRPSPELRTQVLRTIRTVRQEPPGGSERMRAVRAGLRSVALTRWTLAACLAAAAALGGVAVWQHDQARDADTQARRTEQATGEIAAVLAAPDARTRAAELTGGATGTVTVSHSQDKAVFTVSGMTAPPSGKVYQLWFDDDGTMRSAGLMNSHRGAQSVLMKGAVDGASGMGITVEPAGGSKQPTSAPVALLAFPD